MTMSSKNGRVEGRQAWIGEIGPNRRAPLPIWTALVRGVCSSGTVESGGTRNLVKKDTAGWSKDGLLSLLEAYKLDTFLSQIRTMSFLYSRNVSVLIQW